MRLCEGLANQLCMCKYVQFPIKVPSSSGVADNTFADDLGHSDDYSLSDAFWTCSNMFANW